MFTYGQRRFHRCIIRFMWVVSAKVQWASFWPPQTTTNSRKGNLFQYTVGSLDLVKFFGAICPIYRGELLLNFVTCITCMQYYPTIDCMVLHVLMSTNLDIQLYCCTKLVLTSSYNSHLIAISPRILWFGSKEASARSEQGRSDFLRARRSRGYPGSDGGTGVEDQQQQQQRGVGGFWLAWKRQTLEHRQLPRPAGKNFLDLRNRMGVHMVLGR